MRASRLGVSGVNLKTVQELMGPESIAMTARYSDLAANRKLRALGNPGSHWDQFRYKVASNWLPTPSVPRGLQNRIAFQFIESK